MFWEYCYLTTVAVVWVISLTQLHRYKFSIQLLSVLLFVALIVDALGFWLIKQKINNQFLYHIYNPIEYAIIGNVYASAFKSVTLKRWVRLSAIAFAIFCAYNAFLIQSIYVSPSIAFVVEWTLVLLLVLRYFYELYNDDSVIVLYRQHLFWISIGNFFFYAGTFFVMGLVEEVKKSDKELASSLFLINVFLNIIMYTLWGVGFLCKHLFRNNSSLSSEQ